MANARQIVCCVGPPRNSRYPPPGPAGRTGQAQTLLVPDRTKFK